MQVIKEICDKVAVIQNGLIAENGPVLDVFINPQQPITKEFISVLMSNELPAGFDRSTISKDPIPNSVMLTRLTFIGAETDEPVISRLIKNFDLNVGIVFGQIDHIKNVPFGRLMVAMEGRQMEIDHAIEYLKGKNLKVEVIGYVARHDSASD